MVQVPSGEAPSPSRLSRAAITPPILSAQRTVRPPRSKVPSDIAVKIIACRVSKGWRAGATRCMFRLMAQRKTLLVVDDNEDLRGAIAEQLQLSEEFSA